jgi:HAD superfamily hydrolase (TIGR01509 family)
MGWDAVIFDCDGVLVDSEPISNRVMTEMLTEIGLAYTPERTTDAFMGRSMASCMSIIERELGCPPPEGFTDQFERRTFALFRRELRPIRGVEEMLDRLPWPVCVASSGDHVKLRTTLTHTGLWDRFAGRIFSAVDVGRGKPYPDLYLFAAERMGADPTRCAVVEDSLPGVEAGKAAGMTVFAFAGESSPARFQAVEPDVVFREMAELPELLRRFDGVREVPPSRG